LKSVVRLLDSCFPSKLKPTSSQNKQLFKPIVLGFGLASGILVFVGFSAYRSLTGFIEVSNQAMRSHQDLDNIDNIISQLKDAETGQRGYIITGDKAYLEPYQSALTKIDPLLTNLHQANAENQNRKQQIALLETLIAKRLNLVKITIDLRTNEGFEAAARLVRTNEGKNLMDNIRRITQEIHKEENDLLNEQLRSIQASRRNVLVLFSSGIILAFSVILLVYLQIYREIVKRKQIQEVMERQLAAVEAAIDGIAILNPDSQYTYLNQAHLAIFGYDNVEELIGKTWKELYSQEEIARFEAEVFPILGQKQHWRGEATGNKKDGSTIAEEVSLTLLEDGSLICVCQDIRERKKIEASLRTSEQKFRAIFDGTFQFIGLLTTEGILIEANLTALNAIGAKHSEIVGKPFWKTPWWTHSPQLQEQLKQAIIRAAAGELVRFEAEHILADGSSIFVDFSLKPVFDEAGKVVMLIPEGRDISERKQIEEELREQRLALEYAAEGIARLDARGRYITVNKAYASIVGYAQEEMLGMEWQSIVHPEDITDLSAAYQQMLAYGKGEAEARGLRKDGSVFYKQVTMVSAWDKQHNFIGYYCFMKNISDRKQLEAELKHREERFRILVNHAPVGIFQTDSQGNCLFVNPQWTKLTRLSLTEALGTGWTSALHPDDRDRVFDEWYDSIKCDREFSLEYRLKTPDDEISWVFGRSVAIREESGEISGYFGTVIDITERKQAEERFRLAFNDAAIGMALVSSEGDFLQVNKALCDIVGYSESELLATNFQSITHPDDVNADLNYVARMLTGEIRTYQIEKRYFHKQGHIVWILLNVSLVRDHYNCPLYFIAQIQNISERKQAEEQLKASLQEKEVLLKEVHHRVKNNLQVIDSLFRHQCRQTKDSQVVSILKECQNRVGSMALLHEKLYQSKDLAKIELAEYIKSIVSNLFYSYSFNGNTPEIKLNIEPIFLELEATLSCGLIVNELVSNCLKYAFLDRKGGQIQIFASIYEHNIFELVVQDNGIGFPKDFDLENSKSLGLKIVKSLTRQLGGNLELNFQQGTEFIITFKGKEESCSLNN
jgi:PAS domain S-box-containing protein